MMTDPIADMLTRIRNAVRVERPSVDMPTSKVKRGLAEVLKREGYIWDWKELDGKPAPQLRIDLKYGPNGERVIRHLKRVSKPGRRVYSGSTRLKPILNGLGISILSTSRGVISDREEGRGNGDSGWTRLSRGSFFRFRRSTQKCLASAKFPWLCLPA
jgi:small subunit ribosomal protein S8